jgi:hypothetical protein
VERPVRSLHDPRVRVGERALRPVRDNRARFGGVTSLRDLVRALSLFGCVVFSLRAGLRGVLGLQGSLTRADRGQPALPPGQLNRQLAAATVRPIRGILNRVQPLRLGQQRLDLGGQLGLGSHHPVVAHRPMPARRRPHLRPIQGDPTQRHQTSRCTQAQRLGEQRLQRRPVPGPEPADRHEVRSAACAVRNRKAMSSWQRRSNAREEVTPWE